MSLADFAIRSQGLGDHRLLEPFNIVLAGAATDFNGIYRIVAMIGVNHKGDIGAYGLANGFDGGDITFDAVADFDLNGSETLGHITGHFLCAVFGVVFAFGVMPLGEILTGLGMIAILFGSLAAIFQDNLKRMLAFSSIAQIGYIVLGVGLNNLNGLIAGLVHLFNHAAMKTALFLALAAVFYRIGAVDLASIRGLGRRMPYTMAGFVIAGASLVGLPLTVGFISKWYLLLAAVETGRWSVVVVVVFGSLLALIYTLRVIEAAYFQPSPDDAGEIREAPLAMLAPLMALAAACLYFGIDTGLTVGVAKVAALGLLGGYQ